MPEATNPNAPYANAAHRKMASFYVKTMLEKYRPGTELFSFLRDQKMPSFLEAQVIAHRAFNVLEGLPPENGITA